MGARTPPPRHHHVYLHHPSRSCAPPPPEPQEHKSGQAESGTASWISEAVDSSHGRNIHGCPAVFLVELSHALPELLSLPCMGWHADAAAAPACCSCMLLPSAAAVAVVAAHMLPHQTLPFMCSWPLLCRPTFMLLALFLLLLILLPSRLVTPLHAGLF